LLLLFAGSSIQDRRRRKSGWVLTDRPWLWPGRNYDFHFSSPSLTSSFFSVLWSLSFPRSHPLFSFISLSVFLLLSLLWLSLFLLPSGVYCWGLGLAVMINKNIVLWFCGEVKGEKLSFWIWDLNGAFCWFLLLSCWLFLWFRAKTNLVCISHPHPLNVMLVTVSHSLCNPVERFLWNADLTTLKTQAKERP
jgi:hypothetical protein